MCYSDESNTASIICVSVFTITVIPLSGIPLKVIPLSGIWLRVIPLLVIPLIVILFPISHQSTFCRLIFYSSWLSSFILQNVILENVIAPNNAPDTIVWERSEDDTLEDSARKMRKILKKTIPTRKQLVCYSDESNTASIICMSVISIIVIPLVIPLRGISLRVIPLLVIPLIVILFPISHQSTFCILIFYWSWLLSFIFQNVILENVIAPNNAPDAIVWKRSEDDTLEGSTRKTRKILKNNTNKKTIDVLF